MDWQDKLNEDPTPWLLESNPWTRYRTLTDLMDLPASNPEVQDAYQALINHPLILGLFDKALNWFPQSVTRHNKPDISHYYLTALAELGIKYDHQKMRTITNKATKRIENECFAIRQTMPVKGEPMGKADPNGDEWHALPCDSPLITYALLLTGIKDRSVMRSVKTVERLWADPKGWFCHFFFVEGQFKKHQIGCPMAGLMALQVFSQFQELHDAGCVQNAFVPIQYHKDFGKSFYFFGRSKKFWTLKYPFVWYNGLYLADVLSRFKRLRKKPLSLELVDWILASQDEKGRFRPTSMFKCYKDWDFANKKESSPWITFLCCRILKRVEE